MIDVAIVGAGVAGLSVARALPDSLRIAVAAAEAGSSMLPSAICHPFPGRSARSDHGLEAFAAARDAIRAGALGHPDAAIELDMVRPVDGPAARLWATSVEVEEAARQVGVTIERLAAQAVAERFPQISAPTSAVVYRPAFAIDPASLIAAWRRELDDRVHWLPSVQRLEHTGDGWVLDTTVGRQRAGTVVLCVGSAALEWFPELPLRLVAGELLVAQTNSSLDFLISAGGRHWAPLGSTQLGIGATRHPVGEMPSDDEATERLLADPLLSLDANPARVWRGTRVVVPSGRQPVVGSVPGYEDLLIVTGLGSKGFYWGPLCGRLTAAAVGGHDRVPAALRADRFGASFKSPRIGARRSEV